MKKLILSLSLTSLLACSLLSTSAFAANTGDSTNDIQIEPAVIEVETAALFSNLESSDVQMVNMLEHYADAVSIGSDMAQSSRIGDVADSNALRMGGDVEQIKNITDYAPGTETRSRGELTTGKAWNYDMQSMSQGQKVTINIDYTPSSSNMQVGLKDSNGTAYYTTITDGSASATFSINKAGTYSIYVGNPSSDSINFEVFYILD